MAIILFLPLKSKTPVRKNPFTLFPVLHKIVTVTMWPFGGAVHKLDAFSEARLKRLCYSKSNQQHCTSNTF